MSIPDPSTSDEKLAQPGAVDIDADETLLDIGYCTGSQEDLISVTPQGLSDPGIRRAFIRKVYAIVCTQFVVTVGIIILIHECVWSILKKYDDYKVVHVSLQIAALFFLFIAFVIHIFVLKRRNETRKFPNNLCLLALFTLAMSGFLGCVAVYYTLVDVLIAMGSTCFITLGLTLFSFQTKFDITGKAFYIWALFLVHISIGTSAIFYYSHGIIVIMCSFLGVLVFSMLLVYHTQLLVGGKKYNLSEEEYIFGALTIYISVVGIFRHLLQFRGW